MDEYVCASLVASSRSRGLHETAPSACRAGSTLVFAAKYDMINEREPRGMLRYGKMPRASGGERRPILPPLDGVQRGVA